MAFDYIIYDLKGGPLFKLKFYLLMQPESDAHAALANRLFERMCFYIVYIHYCKSVQSAKASTVNSYTSEHVISDFFFFITQIFHNTDFFITLIFQHN